VISNDTLAVFDMDGAGGYVTLQVEGFDDLRLARRDDLDGARFYVDFHLDEFRAHVGVERPSLDRLIRALTRLDGALTQIAFMLVGDDNTRLNEIRERLTHRWPQWRSSDVVPVVEVRGHDGQFPFDLLPLLDATPFRDFVNVAEVAGGLRRFLGFSAAVRRVGPEEVVPAPLRRAGKIPVQLITYDMAGARDETESFGLHRDALAVDGPWPPAGLGQAEVAERLLNSLYDPAVGFDGARRADGAAQVQHFAVHCATEDLTASGYTLVLGGPGPRERRITLGSIKQGFRELAQQQGDMAGPRSLIVANACGSARLDLKTRGSFPGWFLGNRHRGFVGTETDIPDAVAAVFTEELYEALLGGDPLGEAVVRARRALFNRWQNPLGLLYAYYGDPALVVEDG